MEHRGCPFRRIDQRITTQHKYARERMFDERFEPLLASLLFRMCLHGLGYIGECPHPPHDMPVCIAFRPCRFKHLNTTERLVLKSVLVDIKL